MKSLNNSFAICGFMGVGKTSLYHILKNEYDAFDLDLMIEKENGSSCSHLIREKGIEYFRELEFQTISVLIKNSPHIVFLGGGTQTYKKADLLITKNYTTIYLEDSLEKILSRLKPHERAQRPLIDQATELYPKRVSIYRKSDIIITCHEDIHVTADQLRKVFNE